MSRRIRKVKAHKAECKRHMKKLMANRYPNKISTPILTYSYPQPGDNYWTTTTTTGATNWIPFETTTADWTGNYSQGEWTITTTGS